MDIGRLLQFFQIDLITKAGFGKAWGDLADETDHYEYLEDGDKAVAFLNTIAMSPITRAIVSSLFFMKLFGRKESSLIEFYSISCLCSLGASSDPISPFL